MCWTKPSPLVQTLSLILPSILYVPFSLSLSLNRSIHLAISLSFYISLTLLIYLSISLSSTYIQLSIYLSVLHMHELLFLPKLHLFFCLLSYSFFSFRSFSLSLCLKFNLFYIYIFLCPYSLLFFLCVSNLIYFISIYFYVPTPSYSFSASPHSHRPPSFLFFSGSLRSISCFSPLTLCEGESTPVLSDEEAWLLPYTEVASIGAKVWGVPGIKFVGLQLRLRRVIEAY